MVPKVAGYRRFLSPLWVITGLMSACLEFPVTANSRPACKPGRRLRSPARTLGSPARSLQAPGEPGGSVAEARRVATGAAETTGLLRYAGTPI
jgi:hypothetical protein